MRAAINRAFEPISVINSGGGRLELRIGGASSEENHQTSLTAKEARILAYALLEEAEKLED